VLLSNTYQRRSGGKDDGWSAKLTIIYALFFLAFTNDKKNDSPFVAAKKMYQGCYPNPYESPFYQ